MKDETSVWIRYAEENLNSAKVLFEAGYQNTSLQNTQQSIEKYLKALIVEKTGKFKKTHSINELKLILEDLNISVGLSDDEIELIDSIYIPTKYPLGSALPDGFPDSNICTKCIIISEKTRDFVIKYLNN